VLCVILVTLGGAISISPSTGSALHPQRLIVLGEFKKYFDFHHRHWESTDMEEKKRSYDTIRNHLKKCFETLRIPPLEVESGPSKNSSTTLSKAASDRTSIRYRIILGLPLILRPENSRLYHHILKAL